MAELEPLYSADEMRAAEAGHDVDAMMQRAGAAVAEELMRRFPDARRIALHAGGGANGGDGQIAAEILRAQGRELVDEQPDVVIDALLGTGLKGAPRDETSALIEQINAGGVPVLAVDIPSGVNASTGEVAGAAVSADVTVTMHGQKVGLAVAPGRFQAGEVVVADIGLEPAETEHRLVTAEILAEVPRRSARRQQVHGRPCPRRRRLARHDRRSGARRTRGPARRRRLRDDRGADRVASRPRDARARGGEAAARATSSRQRRRRRRSPSGPGSGASRKRRRSSAACWPRSSCPMVVDADALFELEPGEWPAPRVLTPHEGELARLLGRESKEIAAHRLASVQEAAEKFQAVVVLKGEDSLVAAPGRGVLVCALGLPSLATAGTGDVLTGVTAAFLAKGMEPQRAAAAACAAQQLASHEAAQRYGLVASDVVEALPRALALGPG